MDLRPQPLARTPTHRREHQGKLFDDCGSAQSYFVVDHAVRSCAGNHLIALAALLLALQVVSTVDTPHRLVCKFGRVSDDVVRLHVGLSPDRGQALHVHVGSHPASV